MSRLVVLFVVCTAAVLQYCYAETEIKTDLLNATYNEPLELPCIAVTLGNAINWYFNNSETVINFKERPWKDFEYFDSNNTLRIKQILPPVTARYTCKDAENETIQQHFDLRVYATVKPSDKPKNVVEGDPLEVECKAWGIPTPNIIWSFNGTVLSAGPQFAIKKSKNRDFPEIDNGTLRIENIAYEQAGNYVCFATNMIDGETFGIANGTTVVNVKDKYAALWPFLGICVEVAVLCTIILIYEKRRAKRIEEEERQEEAAHLNANNDNRAPLSDDVRQRK